MYVTLRYVTDFTSHTTTTTNHHYHDHHHSLSLRASLPLSSSRARTLYTDLVKHIVSYEDQKKVGSHACRRMNHPVEGYTYGGRHLARVLVVDDV